MGQGQVLEESQSKNKILLERGQSDRIDFPVKQKRIVDWQIPFNPH